jgi:hypothetical protein
MSIGTPYSLGSNINSTAGSTTQVQMTCASAVPAGDIAVAFASCKVATTVVNANGLTDSKGNTWVQSLDDPGLFYSTITTPLTTSDTITATFNVNAAERKMICALAFTPVGGLNQWCAKNPGVSASALTLTTATLTAGFAQYLIIVAGFVYNFLTTQVVTIDGDYTNAVNRSQNSDGHIRLDWRFITSEVGDSYSTSYSGSTRNNFTAGVVFSGALASQSDMTTTGAG